MAPIKDNNKANLQQRIHAVSNNSVSQMKPACESNRKGKGAAVEQRLVKGSIYTNRIGVHKRELSPIVRQQIKIQNQKRNICKRRAARIEATRRKKEGLRGFSDDPASSDLVWTKTIVSAHVRQAHERQGVLISASFVNTHTRSVMKRRENVIDSSPSVCSAAAWKEVHHINEATMLAFHPPARRSSSHPLAPVLLVPAAHRFNVRDKLVMALQST